jgi:hypothetical protein
MKDRQTRLHIFASTGLMQHRINKFVEPLLFLPLLLAGWLTDPATRSASTVPSLAQASALQGG